MRTRETVLAALALLLVAAPAAAQESDPTLNESDLDSTAPEGDESYLDAEEDASGDPALEERDLDASAPAADESYLDEAEREHGLDDAAAPGEARAPGAGLLAATAALVLAALALRRRA